MPNVNISKGGQWLVPTSTKLYHNSQWIEPPMKLYHNGQWIDYSSSGMAFEFEVSTGVAYSLGMIDDLHFNNGNLYILSSTTNVKKFNASGAEVANFPIAFSQSMGVDRQGTYFYVNSDNNLLRKYNASNGSLVATGNDPEINDSYPDLISGNVSFSDNYVYAVGNVWRPDMTWLHDGTTGLTYHSGDTMIVKGASSALSKVTTTDTISTTSSFPSNAESAQDLTVIDGYIYTVWTDQNDTNKNLYLTKFDINGTRSFRNLIAGGSGGGTVDSQYSVICSTGDGLYVSYKKGTTTYIEKYDLNGVRKNVSYLYETGNTPCYGISKMAFYNGKLYIVYRKASSGTLYMRVFNRA